MSDLIPVVRDALVAARDRLDELASSPGFVARVAGAGEAMAGALAAGGKVISCGNGGSMSQAMHFAEEFTGRFRDNRRPLSVLAISDPAYLTCASNDFGFEHSFERFVRAVGNAGDVLLAISTGGASVNVVAAARAANALGMTTIALVGRHGSPLGELARIELVTPSAHADDAQDQHAVVLHALVRMTEIRLGVATPGGVPTR